MACSGCKYWSEKIAMAVDSKVSSVCLNKRSEHSGIYMKPRQNCVEFAAGDPIDSTIKKQ